MVIPAKNHGYNLLTHTLMRYILLSDKLRKIFTVVYKFNSKVSFIAYSCLINCAVLSMVPNNMYTCSLKP